MAATALAATTTLVSNAALGPSVGPSPLPGLTAVTVVCFGVDGRNVAQQEGRRRQLAALAKIGATEVVPIGQSACTAAADAALRMVQLLGFTDNRAPADDSGGAGNA